MNATPGQRAKRVAGILIACALLLLAAAGCGSSDEQTEVAATSDERADAAAAGRDDSGPTEARLHPVGDSQTSGTVIYRKTPAGTPLLKIRVQGLDPTVREEKYVIWQASSPNDMVPLATYIVKPDGRLNKNLAAGFESIAFLEDGSRTEVIITKVGDDDLWREGLGAGGEGEYDPAVPGKFILRGPIAGPLVGG